MAGRQQSHSRRTSRQRSRDPLHPQRHQRGEVHPRHRRALHRQERRKTGAHRVAQHRGLGQARPRSAASTSARESWSTSKARIRTDSWDDKETGVKKYRTEIIANTMQMLDKKGDDEGGGYSGGGGYRKAAPAGAPPAADAAGDRRRRRSAVLDVAQTPCVLRRLDRRRLSGSVRSRLPAQPLSCPAAEPAALRFTRHVRRRTIQQHHPHRRQRAGDHRIGVCDPRRRPAAMPRPSPRSPSTARC